jgi:hypothetical protein
MGLSWSRTSSQVKNFLHQQRHGEGAGANQIHRDGANSQACLFETSYGTWTQGSALGCLGALGNSWRCHSFRVPPAAPMRQTATWFYRWRSKDQCKFGDIDMKYFYLVNLDLNSSLLVSGPVSPLTACQLWDDGVGISYPQGDKVVSYLFIPCPAPTVVLST